MLYLRNTNQLQTISQQVLRGPVEPIPPTPPTASVYFDGLGRTEWSVGFGAQGAPAYTATSFTTSSIYWTGSVVADSGSLLTTFTPNITGSAQWKGYFKPETTSTYTFYLRSDDGSTLWIGNEATASLPQTASALLNAASGGDATGSIALVSGSYYPMLVWYTGHASPDYFTASFSSISNPKMTDFTGFTYCNTSSLGF